MHINKVITSFQDVDSMENINILTGLDAFSTDNWCDLGEFEEIQELNKFITEEELQVLKDNSAEYIAFRLDC